jgi:hypothetical protein
MQIVQKTGKIVKFSIGYLNVSISMKFYELFDILNAISVILVSGILGITTAAYLLLP